MYIGDFLLGAIVYKLVNVRDLTSGQLVTLTGATIAVYEGNNTTEGSGAYATITTDYDSRTGLENIVIDTSNGFFSAGKEYHVIATAGTYGSNALTNWLLFHFSIENRCQKADIRKANGTNITASGGVMAVNATQLNGTAQTARDIGASVLLSSGTGTGQLDFTAGIVKSNLIHILGSLLTETVGGYLAAAFKKLLDVASPVFTVASVNQSADIGPLRSLIAQSGTLVAASSTTATLPVAIAGSNNAVGWTLIITGGTGAQQSRTVVTNSTTILTLDTAWNITPDATSTFILLNTRTPALHSSASAMADVRYMLGYGLSESVGGRIRSNFISFFDQATVSQTVASSGQTGDAYAYVVANIGTHGAQLTALGDTRLANLDATVSSRARPIDVAVTVNPTTLDSTERNAIAAAVATTILVDGSTNKIKANADNTITVAATATRAAVGLAAADLDTQLANILAASGGGGGGGGASASAVVDALMAYQIDNVTFKNCVNVLTLFCMGRTTLADNNDGTQTITFYNRASNAAYVGVTFDTESGERAAAGVFS